MKDTVQTSSIVLAAKDCASSPLDGELVLLFLQTGKYFGFNAMSTWIWNAIQEPRTVDEIDKAIQNEFNVEPQRSRRELITFLEALAAEGLIEVRRA